MALAVSLCVLAAGALADPPQSGYYGANIQDLLKETFVPPTGWNAFIATMGTDSLNTARMDAQWSWVEPKAPLNGQHTYVWNNTTNPAISMDNMVAKFAEFASVQTSNCSTGR